MDASPAPPACPVYRPDHNGECLNCDDWYDAHTSEAIAAGARLDAEREAVLTRTCPCGLRHQFRVWSRGQPARWCCGARCSCGRPMRQEPT